MNITRDIVIKSFIWKFLERIGAQLISFIVTIILARLLMPSEYGLISLITIFINICSVIIDGGLNTALIQKKNADNTDYSTIFYFSLVASIILYGCLYVSAPSIARFYNEPILIQVIRVLGVNLILFAINSIQRAYVAKHMLFKKLFYSSFISSIISGFIGIISAFKGLGIWALVIYNMSNVLVSCLMMWLLIEWRPLLTFSYRRFAILFDFGWKIFLANLITIVFVELRKIFIGKVYSPSDLAYYERGEQFPSLIMNNIFTSVQTILLPTLSEYQDDKNNVKNMMRRSTKLSCFVVYPLMVGLIVVAEPLVRLLLTEKWISVVPFIQIMCIANFFKPISISNWEAIKAMGYSNITLKLEIFKKIIDIIILLISIMFGVTGIAWGVVAFNCICVFINLYPNIKLLGYTVTEQLLDAAPTFAISIMMGAIIYLLRYIIMPDILLLSFQFILGAIIYILLCHIIGEKRNK